MNQAQLLEALRTAMEKSPSGEDAYTANELMGMLGFSGPAQYKKLLDTLADLWRQGLVECFKVERRAPSRMAKVPGYRFKKAS